jgi:23S rRNA (uracil1939-C5)-methyltransferase
MKERTCEATIQKLAKDGKGRGTFLDGAGNKQDIEVPFCMPQDKVEADYKKKRRGIYSGRLLRVVEPAKERLAPRCTHFAACGGCSFQEIPYEKQLEWKQQIVANYFSDLGSPLPILGCRDPWGYRNKMEFSFSQDKAGTRYLGLFLAGSRGRVFNLTECHLVSSWFAEDLEKVRAWWASTELKAYHPPADSGTLRTITFREGITSGDRMVILTVSGNPQYALHQPELKAFQALFDPARYSGFLRIHQAVKGQPTAFYEMHLQGPEALRETLHQVKFLVSPAAFFQPNTLQAERLYREALKLADLTCEDVVYDLYCGTGTLGLLSAGLVKTVLGIEISPESSLDARENARLNGLENVKIITGSVGDILKKKEDYPAPTLLFIDPPRSGLDLQALAEVIALESKKLIYISCNPETQSRDVKLLKEAGYAVLTIQPVDQFPHTPHIENIVVMGRSDYT